MSGINELLDALLAERNAGREVVLATVVKVEGSAYRRPGARMLVPRFGRTEGVISGGCLEADVARKAWWLTEEGPTLRSYSTSEDDGPQATGFGLGCNGVVHVLFERITGSGPDDLTDALIAVRDTHRPAAIATVIAEQTNTDLAIGDRLVLTPEGRAAGRLLNSDLAEQVHRDVQLALERGKSSLCRYVGKQHDIEVFLEYVPPPRRLVVFGGGHDAQPLVRMAKLLGWHVSVVDGRAHFARPERFPEADQALVSSIDSAFVHGELVRGAAVAVMTHSLIQDAHWLQWVLQHEPCYVGQLGPRQRTEDLLDGIRERLGAVPGLDRLHYPVGLDLGGDAPESVALSVLAEIEATLNGRNGGRLSQRAATIHEIEPMVVEKLDAVPEMEGVSYES